MAELSPEASIELSGGEIRSPKVAVDGGQIVLLSAEEEATIIDRAIMTLGPTAIQHFEQRDRPADYYSKRKTNKPRRKNPFPSRSVLKRIRAMPIEMEGEREAISDPAGTKWPRVIRFEQFRALYDAIASSSGWWPLADARWESRQFFSRLEKYVMYLDDMPIGMGALERHNHEHNLTRIVFVGIVPAMQGYRLGNYLFNFINHLAREGGTEVVILSTAPEFDTMKGTGKPEQSAAKMYIAGGFKLVQTDIINARAMAASGKNLETLNLPAYYKTRPGFSKESLMNRLCEEYHCTRPYLPVKTKRR